MNEYLFKSIDYDNDPFWVIKSFFNSIDLSGKFLWALHYIINKDGCCVEQTCCNFPNFHDSDPESHFEGMRFGVWENEELIVSEEVGFQYLKLACEKYSELHPEDRAQINKLLMDI